jgi:hypothetical protein
MLARTFLFDGKGGVGPHEQADNHVGSGAAGPQGAGEVLLDLGILAHGPEDVARYLRRRTIFMLPVWKSNPADRPPPFATDTSSVRAPLTEAS